MHSQQNSNDSALCGHWLPQDPISSQPESQFLAPSAHYGEVEDATHHAMSYSFAPPAPSFGPQDSFNELPSIQPSLSAPSGTTFTPTVQSMPMSSTVGSRLPSLQHISKTGSSQSDQSYEQSIHPFPKPRKPMPRTSTTTSDWEEHYDKIKRLWIDENKTLPETMEIMANAHGFKPS